MMRPALRHPSMGMTSRPAACGASGAAGARHTRSMHAPMPGHRRPRCAPSPCRAIPIGKPSSLRAGRASSPPPSRAGAGRDGSAPLRRLVNPAHGSLVKFSSKRRWICPAQSILPCRAVGSGQPGPLPATA
jgi:hypothetical protein